MKKIPWNKGLTKDTDARVAAYAKTLSKTSSTHCSTPGCGNERKTRYLMCNQCRNCSDRYGITAVDRENILIAQNGCCAVCNRKIEFTGRQPHSINSAVLDHCHKTKVVRGVLCHRCNTMMAVIDDYGVDVYKIEKYLLSSPSPNRSGVSEIQK